MDNNDLANLIDRRERLDKLNGELQSIMRLLNKPNVLASAPEVMDVIRSAAAHVFRQSSDLAYEMRCAELKESDRVAAEACGD